MNQLKTAVRYAGVLVVLVVLSIATAIQFVMHDSNPADAAMFAALTTGTVMFIIGRLFKPVK